MPAHSFVVGNRPKIARTRNSHSGEALAQSGVGIQSCIDQQRQHHEEQRSP
jgi:hypothetical protein